jgi:hypothetical protein
MTLEKLDLLFPFIVFGYGALITFVLNQPVLERLAETRLPPPMRAQLQAHRGLALFCLVAGGLWSLQNLWLTDHFGLGSQAYLWLRIRNSSVWT